jgi:UDP-glucose 4-epimerase
MGKSKNDKSTIDENTSNGGLGFIGSHTVVELQNEGFEVVIVDDLLIRLKVLDGIDAITGKFRHSKIRFTDRDKVQDFSKETTIFQV